MTRSHLHQKAVGLDLDNAETLLDGVLAAAQAALPQGLDLLVWGAARLGDHATLSHLLANGGGSSWMPRPEDDGRYGGISCLAVASEICYEEVVKELLESGIMDADEDSGPCVRSTPLGNAAFYGHEGVIELLVKAGADVNKPTTSQYGATPLHCAAFNGHEGVVELLVKAGADVDKVTAGNGAIPLHVAAQHGYVGMVEQLVIAGAYVNQGTIGAGLTPLYIASKDESHEGVVEQLLKAGADPNTDADVEGYGFPLSIASFVGSDRICSLLLKAGENVNYATGDDGFPALRTALQLGHRDVALVLMEHGASPGNDTLTPAMLEDLINWMAEALAENKRVIAEKDTEIDEMVQRIPKWCAQAASFVAAEEKNDGSSDAPALPL